MATIDEKQSKVADWLVRRLLEARPGPDALWNIAGAPGAGKTAVLRLVQEALWSHNLIPVLVTAPSGEVDAAPIALLEMADQLHTHRLLNGAIAPLSDPTQRWADKMAAITSRVNQNPQSVVLLCDEPTRWYPNRQSLLGDPPAYTARLFAEWIAKDATCRRVISGRIPGEVPARSQTVVPRLDDGRAFLAEYRSWGEATPLVEHLRECLGEPVPYRSLGEMKLCVALARFREANWVVEQALSGTPADGLLDELLNHLEGDMALSPWRAALARLAVPRTAITGHIFDELTRELSPSDRALIRSCLCVAEKDRVALHPAVRHDVIDRARNPQRQQSNKLWRSLLHERKALHQLLSNEYMPRRGTTYRGDLESLHHELLGDGTTLSDSDERLRFVEQLHEIGRTLSYVHHEHRRAADLFRLALKFDPDHPYSHHYLAFNLDWLAEQSSEVEAHYQKAIDLQPMHPWWWSRWISYLATRGRFQAARGAWRDALDAMSVSEDGSPEWVYSSLHRWVARWLLHWAELDFAEDVLRSIPAEIANRDTSIQALWNLLRALRIAEQGTAVFPLTVPVHEWWSPNGHTGLPLTWQDTPLRSWNPARIAAVDSHLERLFLIVADRPINETAELEYHEVDLSRAEVEAAAQEFTWQELAEGRFLELAYYGEGNALRIGLHRDTEFRDPYLIPLVPPPDRWYQHAVDAAWRSTEHPTDGSAHDP